MATLAIGDVSALRWHLPVRTPSDQATEDRVECASLDAAARSQRDIPADAPKIAHVSMAANGEQSDPETAPNASFGLNDRDTEGRAAVNNALGAAAESPSEASDRSA